MAALVQHRLENKLNRINRPLMMETGQTGMPVLGAQAASTAEHTGWTDQNDETGVKRTQATNSASSNHRSQEGSMPHSTNGINSVVIDSQLESATNPICEFSEPDLQSTNASYAKSGAIPSNSTSSGAIPLLSWSSDDKIGRHNNSKHIQSAYEHDDVEPQALISSIGHDVVDGLAGEDLKRELSEVGKTLNDNSQTLAEKDVVVVHRNRKRGDRKTRQWRLELSSNLEDFDARFGDSLDSTSDEEFVDKYVHNQSFNNRSFDSSGRSSGSEGDDPDDFSKRQARFASSKDIAYCYAGLGRPDGKRSPKSRESDFHVDDDNNNDDTNDDTAKRRRQFQRRRSLSEGEAVLSSLRRRPLSELSQQKDVLKFLFAKGNIDHRSRSVENLSKSRRVGNLSDFRSQSLDSLAETEEETSDETDETEGEKDYYIDRNFRLLSHRGERLDVLHDHHFDQNRRKALSPLDVNTLLQTQERFQKSGRETTESGLYAVKQKPKRFTGLRLAKSVENIWQRDNKSSVVYDPPDQNSLSVNGLFGRPRALTDENPLARSNERQKKKGKFNIFSNISLSKGMDTLRENHTMNGYDEDMNGNLLATSKRPAVDVIPSSGHKVSGVSSMLLRSDGCLIREVQINKIPGKSLGFFIRMGNGVDRKNGIFIDRVTLGSIVDVQSLLRAGDEIIEVNHVDLASSSLKEVAAMIQNASAIVLKTKSDVPPPSPTTPRFAANVPIGDDDPFLNFSKAGHGILGKTKSSPSVLNHKIRLTHALSRPGDGESLDLERDRVPATIPKQKGKKEKSKLTQLSMIPDKSETPTESPNGIVNRRGKSFHRAERYQKKTSPTEDNGGQLRMSPSEENVLLASPPRVETDYETYFSDDFDGKPKYQRQFSGLLGVNLRKLISMNSFTKEFYCTVEVDGEYKAITSSKSAVESAVQFDETFEVELARSCVLEFYIFQKHSNHHNMISKACVYLEKVLEGKSRTNLILHTTNHIDLLVNIHFKEVASTLIRKPSTRMKGVFGFNLKQTLAEEENTIPLIVRKCIEEIETRGMDTEGIYRISANARKKRLLRAQFEENSLGTDVSEAAGVDCACLSGILKDYLRELPDPLISQDVFKSICKVAAKSSKKPADENVISHSLRSLPQTNRVTLIYIINHLLRVADHCAVNKMGVNNLAVIFGPTLIANKNALSLTDIDKQVNALKFLLEVWPRPKVPATEL